MKKNIYVALFVFFGLLLQQLAHAVIEMAYIALLVNNWARFSFGWSYETWMMIHNVMSGILIACGFWFGFSSGKHYWKKIYERGGKDEK